MSTSFKVFDIEHGCFYKHTHKDLTVAVIGFIINSHIRINEGETYYGYVYSGGITIETEQRKRTAVAQDFFSVVGPAVIHSKGTGIASSVAGITARDEIGGPIEKRGRLCYINGASDTLLINPLVSGYPCLNHLHFPENTTQALHTHPELRVNFIARGAGYCEDGITSQKMTQGTILIIEPDELHAFTTKEQELDVITFHPLTDFGPSGDNHPMINKTIIDGISASTIDSVKTKQIQ